MTNRNRFWMFSILCLSTSAPAQDIMPSPQQRRAAEVIRPERVSERTRHFIKAKMKHHKADVKQLTLDTVLLNWKSVKAGAMEIATAPRLDRSAAPGDVDRDSGEAFFQLQDELRAKAMTLVDAANREDPKATAQAYGAMLETCATCHAVFRETKDAPQTSAKGL